MTELEKRTWVYVMRPAEYGIAGHSCGNNDPDWSEYQKHLWCAPCAVDFIPEHSGMFDGPIGIEVSALLGISYDRYNIQTGQIEKERTMPEMSLEDKKTALGIMTGLFVAARIAGMGRDWNIATKEATVTLCKEMAEEVLRQTELT